MVRGQTRPSRRSSLVAGPRSSTPSKEEWETRKATIRQLYLSENKTCKAIKGFLNAEGFNVTSRQIKNKLNDWKFERKKTPAEHYLAMLTVANFLVRRGIDIVFDVPKRDERQDYTVQKVKKECDRIKKKKNACDRVLFVLPPLGEARNILRTADIRWKQRYPAIQIGARAHLQPRRPRSSPQHRYPSGQGFPDGAGSLADDGDLSSPNGSVETILGTRSHHSSPVNTIFVPVASSNDPLFVKLTPPDSSMKFSSVHTPNFLGSSSGPSLMTSPTLSSSPSHGSVLTISGLSISSFDYITDFLNSADAAGQENAASLAWDSAGTDMCTTAQNHPVCNQCSWPRRHVDFGFVDEIRYLSSRSAADEQREDPSWSFFSHISSPEITDIGVLKMSASRWIGPYYSQCFVTPIHMAALERSKSLSMEALKCCLCQDNPYIFPGLSFMVLMLGDSGRMAELAAFLDASCTVIDGHQQMRGSFTYASPFHYTLAWAIGDECGMDCYGENFDRSLAQISQIWDKFHPHYLVTAYFSAWHHIHKHKYSEAIPLLKECLPISERVMGRHDLLTINCLVILARAYADEGHLPLAVALLRRAMDPLDKSQEPRIERFRLMVLCRLGQFEAEMGQNGNAEEKFWKVLQGRSFACGLETGDTWSAVYRLCDIFSRTNRDQQAKDLMNYMEKRLNWERDQAWYAQNKRTPPTPPWWWPFSAEDKTTTDSFFRFS
ncbi:uncharacterized protein Z518_08316 [Rhinocladiella mackenziei CBS 650.93]|uniref:Clr5 domain-containing protein n=1 Tax=Rhinocladiella mackenziei CBS 650.93 TaxID=1442369 RepID=A0A0D2J0G1_9EURO|nr:uncharacterized protein Z518_08316 [Rhinocladiella mackenziei CBS 650.93]KIX02375.1 hypothetical protein Z518_08316 [Rhinocladiella mackenziei CBS 650.93]